MNNWQEMIFRVQIEALVTERCAMLAANEERDKKNQTIAYTEEAFQALVNQFANIEERIRHAG